MFNLFSETTPDDVAIVSAFIGGIAIMIFGAAAWYGIKDAIKNFREANRPMAKRNK